MYTKTEVNNKCEAIAKSLHTLNTVLGNNKIPFAVKMEMSSAVSAMIMFLEELKKAYLEKIDRETT